MPLRLEILKELYDVSMTRLLKDHDFLHHFARLFLLAEVGRVNRLYRYVLLSDELESQVDLPESAFAENFYYVVEFSGSWRAGASLLVGALDQLFKLDMLAL